MKVPKPHPQPMKVPGAPQPVPQAFLSMAAAHMSQLGKIDLAPTQPGNPLAQSTN